MISIDLTHKRAIVTGASDGVGAGVARVLAKAGCTVLGTGTVAVDHPRAQAFIERVSPHYFAGDLHDAAVPEQIVAHAQQVMGGIDIIISNAGKNAFTGVNHTTETQWQACMDLNLASHWRLAKAAYPVLLQSSAPVMIVMNSNHAEHTIPGCFPYNVAKSALKGLVQSLAIEWGASARVLGIAPGFIDTPGNQAWFDSFADPRAERSRTEKLHPVGRIGSPDEVGYLCAFLASPLAGFMTGNTLLMDGGRSALMQDPI